MYVTADSSSAFAKPFDMSTVPVVTREQSLAEDRTKKLTTATPTLKAPSTGPKAASRTGAADAAASATAAAQKYAQTLQAIPEIAAFGGVLRSSPIVELTERETEYFVSAVKHLFKEHLVVQFEIKNTLPETVLADVSVVCTPSAADDSDEAPPLEEEFIMPISLLKTDEPGIVYVAFKRPEHFVSASFTNILRFTSKEIDPTTNEPEEGGYEDEYEVSDLDLAGSDYILPAFAGSFDSIYSSLPSDEEHEAEETLQLSAAKSVAEAVEMLIKTLGMQPLEGSEIALSPSTHSLRVYGKSVTGGKVAAQVRMAFSAKSGVTVKITARSEEEGLAALVVGGVA